MFGEFLSTPSARRATTYCFLSASPDSEFLSTPSARRATVQRVIDFVQFFEFLSTPSARRATKRAGVFTCPLFYFYPRPPRGGRPVGLFHLLGHPAISIHALREEGDRIARLCLSYLYLFLSTPSARRATGIQSGKGRWRIISIHALREEGDFSLSFSPCRI